MLEVALLGTGGMMPLPHRHLTSCICRLNGKFLLIDCGEGTQVSLKQLGWGYKNIDVICFTHFHADHISGLPGLLLAIGNSGRTEPLDMVGPIGLSHIVKSLCVIAPDLPFEIIFHETKLNKNVPKEIFINQFNISMFSMEHRIPCIGYSLYVPRCGKFDIEKANALNIPKKYWGILQNNLDVKYDGKIYTSDMVLGETREGIKISYCTDSRPVEGLEKFVENSDLFICEGIYGEEEKLEKAIEHRHMIFSEAAKIAKKAGAKELWLTHFSPALQNPEFFVQNAKNIFPNTYVGKDRMTKWLIFTDSK